MRSPHDRPVFVYGTLRRGGANHRLLQRAKFLGAARTASAYPLLVDGLPYLLCRPGVGHQVEGEVYRVDAPTLDRLDKLEGHPRLYRRRPLVLAPGAPALVVWAYFLECPSLVETLGRAGLRPRRRFARPPKISLRGFRGRD